MGYNQVIFMLAEKNPGNTWKVLNCVIINLTFANLGKLYDRVILFGDALKDFQPSSIMKFIAERSISSTPAYRTVVFSFTRIEFRRALFSPPIRIISRDQISWIWIDRAQSDNLLWGPTFFSLHAGVSYLPNLSCWLPAVAIG